MNKQEAPENITQSAFGAVCRERDQAQKDLDEERHAWEKEREEWRADYAAVSLENKAMREAIKEAHEVLTTAQIQWAHYAEFRDDEDLETAKHLEGKMYRQGQAALAKLQSFLA